LPNVSLTLPATSQNALVVRHALGGLAEALDLGLADSNDLFTAASEACNNVVTHAYGPTPGLMWVEASTVSEGLSMVVRDRGRGPCRDGRAPRDGLGLALMRAIAQEVSLRETPGGGAELRMLIPLRGVVPLGEAAEMPADGLTPEHGGGDDVARLAIWPSSLARRVLPRALVALGAGASFSTDALRDLELLAGWLAAQALPQQGLTVEAEAARQKLGLRLRPVASRAGQSDEFPYSGSRLKVARLEHPADSPEQDEGTVALAVTQTSLRASGE
jgi:serine/threonine-protein kinase RsbW